MTIEQRLDELLNSLPESYDESYTTQQLSELSIKFSQQGDLIPRLSKDEMINQQQVIRHPHFTVHLPVVSWIGKEFRQAGGYTKRKQKEDRMYQLAENTNWWTIVAATAAVVGTAFLIYEFVSKHCLAN